MRYDAVIFDKDGVLLDSMDDNFKWADRMRVEMAQKVGKDIDMDTSQEIVHAGTAEELERIAHRTDLGIDIIKEMEEEVARRKIQKMEKGEIGLFPTTKEVLQKVSVPKAVVSNAPYQTTRFTVEKFGLEKHFEVVKSPGISDIREYVELKKPNPQMLEESIEHLEAKNPVMVGDSEDDIKAAKNAGIDSIFVNTNGGTDLNPSHEVEDLHTVVDIVEGELK